MADCKLCLLEKKLLKKSHIIPDFMYKELFDKNHKMIAFNPQDHAQKKGFIKHPSSGEYESNILCQDCDNRILGGYENYGSAILKNDGVITGTILSNGKEYTKFNNVEYKRFKLFILSILWRAGISSRKEFNSVELGPHSEVLRKMLYEGNAGEIDDYPILLVSFINGQKMPRDVVLTPTKMKSENGLIYYAFPIAGIMYCIYVNSKYHKLPKTILNTALLKDNTIIVVHIPKGKEWEFVFKYVGVYQYKN